MPRAPMSVERQRAATIQGCLRQLARGERLVFRVLYGPDRTWSVDSATWLNGTAASRGEALAAARAAVAAMLEVDPDVFDVELAGASAGVRATTNGTLTE